MVKPEIWPVDAHIKVFKDTEPENPRDLMLEGVKNEYIPGQFAIRSEEPIEITIETETLTHLDTGFQIPIQWNFVGFVPIRTNTPGQRRCDDRDTPLEDLIRKAPCEIPDPLLEVSTIPLKADVTQPVWLTIFVPKDAPAGAYKGRVEVKGETESLGGLDVRLEVYPVTLPDERHLKITNWFGDHSGLDDIDRFHKVVMWSEDFWRIIRAYARNMAEHRQNVIPTDLKGGFSDRRLIRVFQGEGDKLRFDFERFDRWVETFMSEGVKDYIEGAHIALHAWQEADWHLPEYTILNSDGTIARIVPEQDALSPESQAFLSQYLPALQKHLEEKGWVDIYLQHVGDEPTPRDVEKWKKLSELVRKLAPKLKIIDAIQTTEAVGYIDIWVPILHVFDQNMSFFEERKKAGDEVWFYTCCAPTGKYPNRFLDFSLVKVRIIHWMNFKYETAGFLHWGYNAWTKNPFRDTEPGGLPPGDAFIVYPGRNGPLNSIRWEMVREGIEDYELLWLLSQKHEGKEEAMNICNSLIRGITDYEKDPKKLEDARRRIIKAIIEKS